MIAVVGLHDVDSICALMAKIMAEMFANQPDDWGKLLAHSISNKMDPKVSIELAKVAVAAGSHSKLIDYVAAYELVDVDKFIDDMFENVIFPEFNNLVEKDRNGKKN